MLQIAVSILNKLQLKLAFIFVFEVVEAIFQQWDFVFEPVVIGFLELLKFLYEHLLFQVPNVEVPFVLSEIRQVLDRLFDVDSPLKIQDELYFALQ